MADPLATRPDAAADRRRAIYDHLSRRNRVVGTLRVAIPAVGTFVLGLLIIQIVIANTGMRFRIGQVEVTPDSVSIAAPVYSGILSDGSTYRVSAGLAESQLDALDRIVLIEPILELSRADGTKVDVSADQAEFEPAAERVNISGRAVLEQSDGTSGVFTDTVFDWSSQSLVANGGVTINYEDGTDLVADTLDYDVEAAVWNFTRVHVSVPDLPGTEEALP